MFLGVCVCVCVCCTDPIKVYVGNVSLCVMYWPYNTLCLEMLLYVWCTGPKKFLLEISVCVCVCVCVFCTGPIKVYVGNVSLCVMYWSYKCFCCKCFCVCLMYWPYKSLCWKCFCVCVMYWPYKSLCWKCFCVCDVLAL